MNWRWFLARASIGVILTLSATLMLSLISHRENLGKTPETDRPALIGIDPMAGGRGGADEGKPSVFTVMDEYGRTLLITGLLVTAGNEFIAEDNSRYTVISVQNGTALARRQGAFGAAEPGRYDETRRGGYAGPLGPERRKVDALAVAGTPLNINPERDKVAIYHTHSDESYTPTDGQAAIPENGGIYVVGESFMKALRGLGLKVDHDLTAHDPHDSMAYSRSRRTVTKLAQGKPMAMFDVHRDTPPPEAYKKKIKDTDVTQVLMVIGQENPAMEANLGFARQLKDEVDKRTPGLIKGIFMGPGDYNQDLYARNLLLEVGSYTNRREEAEAGISLLADAVPAALGLSPVPPGAPPPKPASSTAERRGTSKALAWVLGLAVLGGGAFLLVSSGGWKQAGARLRNLASELDLGRKKFARWTPNLLGGRRDRGDRENGR